MEEKELIIKIKINKENIASAIQTNNFSDQNIQDQLLLLGILENSKNIIQDRIKKLVDIRK